MCLIQPGLVISKYLIYINYKMFSISEWKLNWKNICYY